MEMHLHLEQLADAEKQTTCNNEALGLGPQLASEVAKVQNNQGAQNCINQGLLTPET